ncbi:MAG: hypothetical protein ACYTF5_21870, partial [Planctomycetota bacterium]
MTEINRSDLQLPTLAQTSLIIAPALQAEPGPTPQPGATAVPVGPPASLQLGLKRASEQRPGDATYWLAVYVTDEAGWAVADGTEVVMSIQGGHLNQSRLRTRQGVATTRLEARSGQPVSVTAVAGSVQDTRQFTGREPRASNLIQRQRAAEQYGDRARAIVRARNAVRPAGPELAAENQTRRVRFSREQMLFHLKGRDRHLTDLESRQAPDRRLSVGFRLTDIRVGQQSLLAGQPELATEGNWVSYRVPGAGWQLLYEVGDAVVEQHFVFDETTPTGGDLVIEGRFQTRLQPQLLSDEAGIRFVPPGARADEVEALGYGPALVYDAAGRQLTAKLEQAGRRLRIIVPAAWLARAEFPVVVDPIIGPAAVVSDLLASANEAAIASDGSDFLTVWSWKGDLYGQRVTANGALSGPLLAISQADGDQREPDLVFNSSRNEYLAVWRDHRFGWSYNGLWAQRIDPDGQLLGPEMMLIPPVRKSAEKPALAVSGSGAYLLVWTDKSGGDKDLYGQMLEPGGAANGPILTLNDNTTRSQANGDVAYDEQENLFQVVWRDERNGASGEIYGQRVGVNGALLGGNQLLASDAGGKDLNQPAIEGHGGGQFLVTWALVHAGTDYDVQAIRVKAVDGQTEGGVLKIAAVSGEK